MTLEQARKILKVAGIITIIGAIISLIMGILVVYGSGDVALTDPEVKTDADYQEMVGYFIISGIALGIAGVCSLIEGVFSILASKNGKYGKICWIFSIISVVTSLYHGIANLFKGEFKWSNLLSLLVSLALNALVLVAANTVKTAYAREQKQA